MAGRRHLLLVLLLVLQLIATTPASRSLSVNGNNIWRRVRLVTSQETDRNAYQVLKPSSRNATSTSSTTSTSTSTSTTTSTTTTTPAAPHSQRSAKQLDLNFPGGNVSSAARLEMSTEFFVVPTLSSSSSSSTTSSTTAATPRRSLGAKARAAGTTGRAPPGGGGLMANSV